MKPVFFQPRLAGLALFGLLLQVANPPLPAEAEPSYGLSMYGAPALPQDFVSLPYANPEAPKGGRITVGNTGGFDSLNPFILKGTVPWQLRFLGYESLMGRNHDEAFALYGLLAESVETGPNREWVEFTLREEARFSDGSPVTLDDVIWSYETLGTEGHPRYQRGFWEGVERIEATGPRSLRISFHTANRELALVAGMRPILKKSQWQGRDFTASGFEAPIGTGPYVIDGFEPGKYVRMKRNPEYWGRDLPLMRGRANLDEIRIEFYGDDAVLFEGFKAGELTVLREFNAEKWATQYDFPAVASGEVIKSEIPDGKPSGITGFVMNTRRAPFDDWRVRQALILAFNFEYMNDTITGGRQARITSYFSGSDLGMRPGRAEGRVRELLAPFADELLPGVLEGYDLPVSNGTERNRKNLRQAVKLLAEAGWSAKDGVMKNADGVPFAFKVLLRQGAREKQAFINIFIQALSRIGINAQIETVDNAQYFKRLETYDFDMTDIRRGFTLSPGNEQKLYWGAKGVETPGSRNLMGMNVPAAEAMIDHMLATEDIDQFTAAVRALDRVLIAGRYVIPTYSYGMRRIAHSKQLHYPERIPINGDGPWFMPDVWWYQE
ncbi:extracellular solute-binding protein [Alisedimentitalea sp. MJ-SS2]|uniref:extracellular solute-binding protein n=1 Tax=Aliisedimentitalea sp. MJ-SS2 TaxID=3049795 RepID=UPI0029061198|nr:extracellular solute-binding protein [Alisedimentitalea sp. MJ-SS2]MDU8926948.1 extracellular solute-binding protein [Alisedimentitalea sp. MJ-SS2]